MGLNPNAVSASMRGNRLSIPVTKPEVFVLLVKLIGVLMLILVDALILTLVGFPP